MLNLLLATSMIFQCFVEVVHESSKYHITRPFKFHKNKRGAKKKRIEKLVREVWEEGGADVRFLAISWVESRLRLKIRRGDKGKACGTFQIHARHSYPLFRRKKGYVDWDESENKPQIERECQKLENISYSIDTQSRLLSMMDKRGLHTCHHNSGFYGKCSTFYRQRIDFWVSYYSIAQYLCNERSLIMAMLKIGAPALATPLEKIQGYLDSIKNKEAQSDSELYMEGYNLASKVKLGEESAPVWAPT
jgi:hypothetical protein